MHDLDDYRWWQKGTIYQIYPRSFQDSNGDGIGDLGGVLQRLDYLEWLGVDALWLSPIFSSPMADFGYDISDYRAIDPRFGTMEDLDRLLDAVHARGMKLILDLVPNHTSDQHPWFREARASRDSPKRDWYLWEDPAPGGDPPNNWLSVFGGSAWEYDEATGQYYYHAFLAAQPDLNWRNPDVRTAMFDVMRFWLDKGADGFRVDVMWHLLKDERLRHNPPNPDYRPGQPEHARLVPAYSEDQYEVHTIVEQMRAVTDAYDDRVLIGEVYLPLGRLVAYYGPEGRGAHLPFNFQLILLPWEARRLDAAVNAYEGALPSNGWPNWVLSNHDKPRVASRVGPAQARVAAMLLLTLRGTPILYYGDELGMENVAIPPDRVQDPREMKEPGIGVGRDPFRTPMPWDEGPNAGFSEGIPWLPLGADYKSRNVSAQQSDPDSMLTLYRRLIALRKDEPALAVGDFVPVPAEGDVLAYDRVHGGRRLLIALNLGRQPQQMNYAGLSGRILLSTHCDREGDSAHATLRLRADEGVIVAVR